VRRATHLSSGGSVALGSAAEKRDTDAADENPPGAAGSTLSGPPLMALLQLLGFAFVRPCAAAG